MYEDLVLSLRKCGQLDVNDECVCCHDGCCEAEPLCMYELMRRSADVIEELSREIDIDNAAMTAMDAAMPRWIPVTEALPSDFVSVQAHMTDAGDFPSVREAYVVDEGWFFPSLKEFHPVDMWKRFDEPPKEET